MFWSLHLSGVFGPWLLSLSVTFSGFVPAVCSVTALFPLWPNDVPLCVCTTVCVPSADGHGLFPPFGNSGDAAVELQAQLSLAAPRNRPHRAAWGPAVPSWTCFTPSFSSWMPVCLFLAQLPWQEPPVQCQGTVRRPRPDLREKAPGLSSVSMRFAVGVS